MSEPCPTTLRPLTAADLPAANAVIESAVMTWGVPERVKRLSLPSYRYDVGDLGHLALVGALDPSGRIEGVAAWEPTDPGDSPNGRSTLLLHGIYVRPDLHRRGIGTHLLQAARKAASDGGYRAIMVRANPDARAFFESSGWRPLPVLDADRDYPHRYLLDIAAS